MPYISAYKRVLFDKQVTALGLALLKDRGAGNLNYVITSLLVDYLDTPKSGYENFNEVLGVLEAVKLELYRRMIAPFEDKKKETNGDCFYV